MDQDSLLRNAHIQDGFALTLARELWEVVYPVNTTDDKRLDSYVIVLERKLRVFAEHLHIIRRFRHLFELVKELKERLHDSRVNLNRRARILYNNWFPHLAAFQPSDRKVYNSIDFAVEIWLLCRFNKGGESGSAGELVFDWRPEKQLFSALAGVFPHSNDIDTQQPHPDRVFSSMFNLRDIHILGDFVIQPTDNILEHLTVQKYRGRKFRITVFIFFHAYALKRMRGIAVHGLNPIFDAPALLDETLKTLALLLPVQEQDVQDWFHQYSAKMNRSLPSRILTGIDPRAACLTGGSRHVRDYHYWRPRLLALEKEFTDSSPRTVSQWWRDRRRWREWAVFWVAALALLLALLSLMVGVVSAVYGGLSLNEASVANSYAREQANAVPTSSHSCCSEYSSGGGGITTASLNTASFGTPKTELEHIMTLTHVVTVTACLTTTVAWHNPSSETTESSSCPRHSFTSFPGTIQAA